MLKVAYANNIEGLNGINDVMVNGASAGTIDFPYTGGWFASPTPNKSRGFATKGITLQAGLNKVRLTRHSGYAEFDYVKLLTADGKSLAPATRIPVFQK